MKIDNLIQFIIYVICCISDHVVEAFIYLYDGVENIF